jgi:hypothetical protein
VRTCTARQADRPLLQPRNGKQNPGDSKLWYKYQQIKHACHSPNTFIAARRKEVWHPETAINPSIISRLVAYLFNSHEPELNQREF